MPDLPRREQIENELLEAMQAAHQQYRERGKLLEAMQAAHQQYRERGKSKASEYETALRAFNDFIVRGKLPDDPKYDDLKSRSAKA